MEVDQQFVEYVVKNLVNQPDKVEISRKVDEMGVLITVKCAADDMGYLIGRQGQTARAVRTLLKVVGAKNNARVNLKIDEPEGSTHIPKPREEREQRAPYRRAPASAPSADASDAGDIDLTLDL